MTTKIDQKAYLQKYLTGSSGDKKKKKKKLHKGKGFKIIDDDLDLSKLRALDGDELDILDQGEDAPVIAGIIDERPEEVRRAELINSNSKWRVINQDDGFNSKLQVEEIKKDIKEQEKENEIVFGKMYSDSEDEKKNDSDASPPRKSATKAPNDHQRVSKKPQNNSDSDFSPPRQRNDKTSARTNKLVSNSKNYDSDVSPPRRRESKPKDKSRKPSRWGNFDEEKREAEKLRAKSPDADASPLRRARKQSDSDASPPRRTHPSPKIRRSDADPSPPRKSEKIDKRKKNYDSDLSPPRKSRKDSPSHSKRRKSPDSDQSPPRKRLDKQNYSDRQPKRSQKHKNKSSDSDLSPPRKSRKQSPEQRRKEYGKHDSPRRDRNKEWKEPDRRNDRRNDDSPPPTNKKMAKTLEGKMAGLQNAKDMRHENEAFKRREDDVFNKMTDDVSGRNAQVVSRKTGKRETSEERRKQIEKAERQKELDAKYKKWSKGLKQIEAQESRYQEFMHEASKPLARHKDDKDLECNLKQIERAGDPMLQYIRDRKREKGELPPEKPTYKGQFPPNRFNIRPGYRWDGVDRSNGYEKKYFDTQSKKRAQQEEYYKWSSADM